MIIQAERIDEGKGMRNIKYPPAFDQWAHEICCISPEAYCSFKAKFAGRSERSFQQIRAKDIPFDEGFTDQMLVRAQTYLANYGYPTDGPLSMAVDDTKLNAALRPYFNSRQKK
jgi:hypothetical protein